MVSTLNGQPTKCIMNESELKNIKMLNRTERFTNYKGLFKKNDLLKYCTSFQTSPTKLVILNFSDNLFNSLKLHHFPTQKFLALCVKFCLVKFDV